MKLDKHQIRLAVHRSIDRINELFLEKNAIGKEDATILIGDNSPLDSMGVVNFLAALEEELTQTGILEANLLNILSPEALAMQQWTTVGSFIDFVFDLLQPHHGE